MQTKKIESGIQLFSRINQRICLEGLNPKLFPHGGPYQNQTIEVVGDYKNDLLLDLLACCILPSELNAAWKDSGALILINDHHLGILKIINTLNSKLKTSNINSRDIKAIIEKALNNLTILNCYNKEEMEMTFQNLDEIIHNREKISLLVIDNIEAHYWIAKKCNNSLHVHKYCKNNLSILQKILGNLNIIFVFGRGECPDELKNVDYKIVASYKKAHVIQYDKNKQYEVDL